MIQTQELVPFRLPPEVSSLKFRTATRHVSIFLKKRLGLRADPLEIFEEGEGWVLRTSGIAGVLTIGGREVEVQPKFLASPTVVNWRIALLRLVELATRVRLGFTGRLLAQRNDTTFYDHVAIAYGEAIRRAAESGPILLFHRIPEELPFLRGRLSVEPQLRLLTTRPGLVAQEVDVLIPNNPISRLLAWGIEFLSPRTRTSDAYLRLDLARRVMPSVPAELPHWSVIERMELPPQHADWRDALDLARLLARSEAVGLEPGLVPVPGVVFDTERLFERLVSVLLGRASERAQVLGQDWRAVGKVATPWLYPRQRTEQVRTVTPDDRVLVAGHTRLLVDAKYKGRPEEDQLSPPSPSREDAYESLAFMVATQCDRILLVYPRVEAGQGHQLAVRRYDVPIANGKLTICTTTVDLVRLVDRPVGEIAEEFRLAINEALA